MTKKVAFCIPNMVIGGVETVFITLLSELIKKNKLDITVISHAKITESLYSQWFANHQTIKLKVCYPLQNWFESIAPVCNRIPVIKQVRKLSFSLYKICKRLINRHMFDKYDVIIDYKNAAFIKELRKVNKPKITWLHSSLDYFEKTGILKRLSNYDKIIAITDEFVHDFKKKYHEYAHKIFRIYNLINISEIQQKAKITNSPKGKYFCHVSRLVDGKDIKTLLNAFDLFAKTHKTVKLYIVGDGYKADDFKEYAQTLKSNKQIIFMGEMNNPYGIMSGAIANILSSEFEGFGMVTIESMALHVPTIVSNYKYGAKEILMHGKAGLLFPIGDRNALSKCMNDVYNKTIDIENITQTASKSLSRFNPTNITNHITDLINAVCKKCP